MGKKKLLDILNDYENNLCSKEFSFELQNHQVINVRFYAEQFCHLSGIQHVFPRDSHFIGIHGYNRIKSGKLTIETLKAADKNQYNTIKQRLECFDQIYDLMCCGELIKFYKDRAKPPTRIEADFVFYKRDVAYILHLFLRQEQSNKNLYAPVSFVIKSLHDRNPEQFINMQEYKKIINRTITDLTI